jgi:hypothetical protein
MPKILTRLRIDEVSAVDRGAGEGVKIVLMKRDDTGQSQERQERSFNAIMAKAEADERGNDAGSLLDHPIVQTARLLVASGHKADIASALDHLLNTANGQALLARMHKATDQPAKEEPMDTIFSIMKDAGIAGVCAAIVAKGSTSFTQAELVEAVTKIAVERYPELTKEQAFAKVYTDQGAEGLSLREAINVAKAMPFVADLTPAMVGGTAAQALDDPAEAIAQLKQLGARKWPTASEAQQFERALTSPENAALARRAVPRPQPTTSYPFPR